ncbi:potassium efflux protein [Escherichia coli]|uniref:Potassium efflux protein n=1 Tax=Escherichia coli TaxID=562 RepID=A0A376TL04_ECOLX|nr:potassium efflux protein [Escherichia coli]
MPNRRKKPTIALEQVNQQTLRITMLLMFALFGVMFWAIWSDFDHRVQLSRQHHALALQRH